MNIVIDALLMSFSMAWEMLWALVLGFTISAFIQAKVSKAQMRQWLADASAKTIARAALFGAASSSCSYAAAAITRSLIKQGADFTAAMAFQFASTNLVLELGILLALLLGWQFTLAQYVGGIFMIVFMSIFFRLFLPKPLLHEAVVRVHGSMEAGALTRAPTGSQNEQSKISHYFFTDWAALWKDILFGLLMAGFLSACIPNWFWTILLCKNDPAFAHFLNPLIGPLIAILSFVCSIGNVPMAAVLWQQGMTFGGVLSFLFADLIVFPLLNIYRQYYGIKMACFLGISFYICMVMAAYCCQWLLSILQLVPTNQAVAPSSEQHLMHHVIAFNYTSVLNIVALVFTAILFIRFYKSGGLKTVNPHCH